MQTDHFDVIVVGAGAAGCVLADRLTEEPSRSVLVIEAGPDYGPDPNAWPENLRDPSDVPADSHPWGYADSDHADDRQLPLPRARVIGGSTTINACTWLRGSAADYDGWAAQGIEGWSFEDLLPYFRRAESDPLGGGLHGTDGPVPVWRAAAADLSPIDEAFASSAERLGFPVVVDLNGARDQRPAIGPRPQNVADGIRMNAAFTYLAQARTRPNLTVLPNTLVDRILIEDDRATGVRAGDGKIHRGTEVVLAAGAYGSPAILMRSGIGPETHLRKLGVEVVAHRPGVGEHLLDHPLVIEGLGEYRVKSSGPAASVRPFLPLMLMARSSRSETEIDLGVLVGRSFDEELRAWLVYPMVCLLRSGSEGRVRLTSTDPEATLDIRHSHLTDHTDMEAMCDGVELVMDLMRSRPLAESIEAISAGGATTAGRKALRAWLRTGAGTMFHASGSCRMTPAADPLGVVDHLGRVHGIGNLRVADASILPSIPRATIHFPVVAAAEKLADAITKPPSSQGPAEPGPISSV
ncbi:MAG: dehydrogenase [Chloroflexota bacterium]|nr:dehydrogenase [Chloroflexota bacterium]